MSAKCHSTEGLHESKYLVGKWCLANIHPEKLKSEHYHLVVVMTVMTSFGLYRSTLRDVSRDVFMGGLNGRNPETRYTTRN